MQSATPKRINLWLDRRILELRGKIQQLKRMRPSNRIGERVRDYLVAHADVELDHWLYFAGEDE
jgi:hypothetical protein